MRVKLETLSPVHVGSGTQYQGNAEYLYFDRERVVVVADEIKILDIIGSENIHIWVNFIEERKDSFLDYLRQRKPEIRPVDVAGRIIPFKGNRTPYFTNTLREQIHGGLGMPYLPGSSIKGAIRTAIFSTTLMEQYEKDGIPERKLGRVNRFSGKFEPGDGFLQQEVFGNDPNSDWMRMLQVGDCYFQTGTHAAFAETLNERGEQRYEIKGDVRQLIEYLPEGASSEFQLTIPEAHLMLIDRKEPTLFKKGSQVLNLPSLFKRIHHHSLRLLDNEIAFFDEADLPSQAEGLVDFLADLRNTAKNFSENECLLRLGFGTGYRNMTGDWVKELVLDDGLYDDIATATRRTPRYNGMPLPKSRKIMFDGVMMGFVKLTF